MSTHADTIAGKANMAVGMRHWNGNLLCAIDTETTGFDPELNEIVEISILPIDANLELHDKYPMLNLHIKPEKLMPEDQRPPMLSDKRLAHYMVNGLESSRAVDIVVEWFEKLNLGQNKRIMPLAHNWPFDRSMIQAWMGTKTFEYIFHGHYRCTQAMGRMLNDAMEHNMAPTTPYATVGLKSMCQQHGVSLMDAHTANADALATLQLYKQMCTQMRVY